MKHTKGNWTIHTVTQVGMVKPNCLGIKGDNKQICIVNYSRDTTESKTKANAKLIAAAPEMLKALYEAKTIIYNLSNNLEKRSEVELQMILDEAVLKATI